MEWLLTFALFAIIGLIVLVLEMLGIKVMKH